MVISVVTALPFSANAYEVSATNIVNVSNWKELEAALKSGTANTSIILTNDIAADPTGYYDDSYFDEVMGEWVDLPNTDYVIKPTTVGNVVIDMNGYNLTLGNKNAVRYYDVENPIMFNLTKGTDLYFVNSQSTGGEVSLCSDNTATMFYFDNIGASLHVLATANNPVTFNISTSSHTSKFADVSTGSSASKCEIIELTGAKINVDSYYGRAISLDNGTSVNTPVFIGGGTKIKMNRQYSNAIYMYSNFYGNIKLYACSFEFGQQDCKVFGCKNTDGTTYLSSMLDSNYYNAPYTNDYTFTNGITATTDAYNISKNLTIGLKDTISKRVEAVTSGNAHFVRNTAYGMISVTAHSFEEKARQEPTCTEDGFVFKICKDCSMPFNEIIPARGHDYQTVITPATLTEDGKISQVCTRCNNEESYTSIFHPAKFKLAKTAYTYSGKAIKPAVTVTDSEGYKIDSSNYTVKYTDNKNVGKATATITFKGNYKGTKKLTFAVNPKGTAVSKVTAGKKQATVQWKKQATQTTGYQIQYSTNKNFKSGNKTVTVKKNATVKTTVKKLTAGKKYYVRIRTYKTVSKKNYYSAWSTAKTVTPKK